MVPSKGSPGKTRVLIVDRSQRCFLTCSMAISREISFEKEFHGSEDRDSINSSSILLIVRKSSLRFPQCDRTSFTRARVGRLGGWVGELV